MVYTLENAGFKVEAVSGGKHMVYKCGQEIHLTPMEYILTEIGIGYRMKEKDK